MTMAKVDFENKRANTQAMLEMDDIQTRKCNVCGLTNQPFTFLYQKLC